VHCGNGFDFDFTPIKVVFRLLDEFRSRVSSGARSGIATKNLCSGGSRWGLVLTMGGMEQWIDAVF
jgi:hypothetical protein